MIIRGCVTSTSIRPGELICQNALCKIGMVISLLLNGITEESLVRRALKVKKTDWYESVKAVSYLK